MRRLEHSFELLKRPKVQSFLEQRKAAVNVRMIRRKAHDILAECFYGKWVCVPMESDEFLERHRAIAGSIRSLESIRACFHDHHLDILGQATADIISVLESFDY